MRDMMQDSHALASPPRAVQCTEHSSTDSYMYSSSFAFKAAEEELPFLASLFFALAVGRLEPDLPGRCAIPEASIIPIPIEAYPRPLLTLISMVIVTSIRLLSL